MSEDTRHEIMGLLFMIALLLIGVAIPMCSSRNDRIKTYGAMIGISGGTLMMLSANFPK